MNDLLQPLIHKAALREISVHIGRARLSINDSAALHLLPDGRIGVFMRISRPFLGLIPRQATVQIGVLSPNVAELLADAVERGESLRVRIVGLTPEHLTQPGQGPEIHISIWGDPRRVSLWAKPNDVLTPPPLAAASATLAASLEPTLVPDAPLSTGALGANPATHSA